MMSLEVSANMNALNELSSELKLVVERFKIQITAV